MIIMSKKNNLKEAQPSCHQVAEPAVAYGVETNVDTLKRQPSSRERILESTMSVDKYFDKVLKRDMTPEELYAVVVDDVKAIYADESIFMIQ